MFPFPLSIDVQRCGFRSVYVFMFNHVGVVLVRCGLVAMASLLCAGCSMTKFAANRAGDALSGTGTAFASDDDPELVKAAAPFSLKLMESVLEHTPEHRDLLLSACSGFTQFAYAFIEQEADEISVTDFGASQPVHARARRMYLRAREYGLRGLEVEYPRLRERLHEDPKAALRQAKEDDVPLLYWTAASWGKAISLSKDDPHLLADISTVEALIDRALELDPNFERGSIHTFLISYEMIRARGAGEARDRAKRHFDRAIELTDGKSAAPYLALAEATCIPAQDRATFESLLQKALAVDPDLVAKDRLINTVMQKRARWLLGRLDELFLPAEDSTTNEN